jgi:hypothetical protein
MKVSAIEDKNWIRLSDVEGAIKGTQDSLKFAVSTFGREHAKERLTYVPCTSPGKQSTPQEGDQR